MSPLTFITSLTILVYYQLTDAIINIINHLKQRQTSEEVLRVNIELHIKVLCSTSFQIFSVLHLQLCSRTKT